MYSFRKVRLHHPQNISFVIDFLEFRLYIKFLLTRTSSELRDCIQVLYEGKAMVRASPSLTFRQDLGQVVIALFIVC